RRGGGIDVPLLGAQLGAPVALVSASKGEGFEKIFQFLSGATHTPERVAARVELPVLHVLQDVPACRAWAAKVGAKGKYRAPAPPEWTRRLDGVFLHPVAGPIVFALVVIAVFQAIFSWATPLMSAVSDAIQVSGVWLGAMIPNDTLRSLVINGI